ncbi:MAG: pantetheine-phosphate adenylyltransferase [Candidatus Diapherotrites archaeon]|uniref:Phosphopantetheine adenylyltransferase n=1 Tax=Candidatus Iainarchaeum sp. TaxID=3101447 RepID=A0A2D6LPY1_9ARCH|nr:pantetheine-phosphate adenylyltransferase [Candidatus Diapherotrites archaeon]|tara:strand:+ start:3639 stop:4115 length:477 start_codon:yes stop_codon:yes gene_type:complete
MKAIYPGTFDPLTNGHLDVIKRGLKMFNSLIIGVAVNPAKKPLFSTEERIEMIKESVKDLENVEVKAFDSLLVDFIKKENGSVILRGLRETSDFPAEFQHAIVNRKLDPEIETVFVMTNAEYFYITSGIVKEVAMYNGKLDTFVPKQVESKLKAKYAK